MRFRLGFLLGAGIGYVLGARAGRERYRQIVEAWEKLRKHPAAAQLIDQMTGLVDAGRHLVAGGLSAGGKGLRAVADGRPNPPVS